MNSTYYIRTQDPHTIAELKRLGFVVLSEQNGIVTFLNDEKQIKKYNSLNVTYTNKLEFGG